MNRKTVLGGLILIAVAGLCLPQSASAMPIFARKYGFNCTMCHSNVPRLNDFGERYRMNGYQLAGQENTEKSVLESPAPIAFRTSAGFFGEIYNDAADEPDLRGFRVNGLDLLSAGQLGTNIGYAMVYLPQIAEQRGLAKQEGMLESASIVFRSPTSDWFAIRAGRFEPAYVAFSVRRQLSVASREIYEATFPGGPAFSGTQSGVEITGYDRKGLRYAVGLVGGAENNTSNDFPADVYLRLDRVVGAGQGQTAGHRLGVIGYLGQARPASTTRTEERKSFLRAGADASINLGVVNLALQYLVANDDRSQWSQKKDVTYSGGFAEITVMPKTDCAGYGRVDYLKAPSFDKHDVLRVTLGCRHYPVDNVALQVEYSMRSVKKVAPETENATASFAIAQVDFAF